MKIYHQRQSVRITVYVAKPRRSKHAPNHEPRRAGHRHPALRNAGAGYDRKAQLLHYSRYLRATACREQPAASGHRSSQPLHKVKEVLQITSIRNSQQRVTEILKITSSHNPDQHKVKQDRQQISSSHKPQHRTDHEVLQFTNSRISQHKTKEVRQISRSSSWKVVPVEHKPDHAKLPRSPPSCFGYWKRVLFPPCFVRSLSGRQEKNDRRKKKKSSASISLTDRMNAIAMSSRMEKERNGIMAKFLSAFGKNRC